MSRTARHRAGSVALGGLFAGSTYWLGIDVLLSSALGVALAGGLLVTLRVTREFPTRRTGEGWQDGRWTALSLVVANFGALVGLQMTPLPDGYRAAVAFLVILVGFTAYLGGSLAEMEREPSDTARPGDS